MDAMAWGSLVTMLSTETNQCGLTGHPRVTRAGSPIKDIFKSYIKTEVFETQEKIAVIRSQIMIRKEKHGNDYHILSYITSFIPQNHKHLPFPLPHSFLKTISTYTIATSFIFSKSSQSIHHTYHPNHLSSKSKTTKQNKNKQTKQRTTQRTKQYIDIYRPTINRLNNVIWIMLGKCLQ